MAFNVKNGEADQLLRELTELTGESLTEAITVSLRERLDRERRVRAATSDSPPSETPLDAAIERLRAMPVTNDSPDDDNLEFDHHGIPT